MDFREKKKEKKPMMTWCAYCDNKFFKTGRYCKVCPECRSKRMTQSMKKYWGHSKCFICRKIIRINRPIIKIYKWNRYNVSKVLFSAHVKCFNNNIFKKYIKKELPYDKK